MDAVKELRELINKANITDARKHWLDIEVCNMAAAVSSFNDIEKDAIKNMKAINDTTIQATLAIMELKNKIITSAREQVEAEDSAKEANNIINQN